MNIDSNQFSQSEKSKCKSCQQFYASQAFKGYCSSCYKKYNLKNQTQVQQTQFRKQSIQTQPQDVKQSVNKVQLDTKQIKLQQKKVQQKQQKQQQQTQKQRIKQVQVDKKRCFDCKKKTGLLGIQCKCGYVYCNSHRLPENHSCQFDHHQISKDRLKSTLVKVYNGQLNQI